MYNRAYHGDIVENLKSLHNYFKALQAYKTALFLER